MRQLLVISALLASIALTGCGTTDRLVKKEPKETTVCEKVTPPREVALKTFTFFPVPAGTTGEGGVSVVAGLTADGITAILENFTTLKKREESWQGRSNAVNKCLETEVKQRAK